MSPAIATTSGSPAVAAARASPPRASVTTRQPRSERARTSASPSPREPPVTIPTGTLRTVRPARAEVPEAIGPRTFGLPDQPGPHRHDGRLRPVRHAQLLEHVAHVRLHGLLREPQLERDPLVREAASDQLEHLALARREPVERIVVRREVLHELRRHHRV